jgi:cytochrome c-type biogenesis protein CcmH/NrfG
MNKAISIVPADIYYRSLSEIYLVELNAIVTQDSTKISKEDLQKQVQDSITKTVTAAISARDADPWNYLNWTNLGRVYHAIVPLKIEGAYESAAQSYSEAFRRNPKNPGIFLLMAQLEADHENLANAKNYALQAIQVKQNYVDAYYLLAQIEVADKNLKGAIESITALSVLSPNDPNVFFQLGYLKFNGEDYAGAIESLEKALTLSPEFANAKYYLGISYEAVRDHSKALQQFRDLKKTNPDSKEVTDILALLEAGKSIFDTPVQSTKTGSSLPVKERE